MVGQMQEKMIGPHGVCFQTCCCSVALGFIPYGVGMLAQWCFLAAQGKNVLLRTRELYSIPGDECNDCLCACFCLPCAMCRVYRHVNDYRGADADKTVCCDCSATLDAPHPPTHAWMVNQPQRGVVMQQPGVAYGAQPGVYGAQQPPMAQVAQIANHPVPAPLGVDAKHVGTGAVVQGGVVQGEVVHGPQARFDPYTGQPIGQPGPTPGATL